MMPPARRYTIDASVFLNAFNSAEPGYRDSNQLLDELHRRSSPIILPSLVFPEVAATISRVQGDAALARSFAQTLRRWPGLIVVALDDALAQQAVDVAAQHQLRGSDAVYVAVAIRFACVLVTLDCEQRQRAAGAVSALAPADALAESA